MTDDTAMGVLMRLLGLVVALLAASLPAGAQGGIDDDALYLFWGDGCPHCERELAFLSELAADHPELEIRAVEVWHDQAGRDLFVRTLAELGEEPRGVPTTVYDGRVWVGFDQRVAADITAAVEARLAGEEPAAGDGMVLTVPLLGEVDVGSGSLLGATLLIGFVDGFNPCSLWVLTILLALVVRTGSRTRVLLVGGVFLAVTALLYGVYIAGLYGALSYLAQAAWVRVGVAAIALAFGIVNVKDYLWFRQGPSLTIADEAKPGLYRRMRGVTDPQRPLPVVLAGTVGLAAGVSILETPCTAGYPLLWADLVSGAGVGLAAAAVLFGVYLAVFLLDELAIFAGAVVAMRVAKLEERAGRLLKLVGGTLMITLAGVLILAPEAMTRLGGVGWVLAVSAGLTAAIVIVDRSIRGRQPAA